MIKWIDNEENDKAKLRTNNSEDDLVCKDEVGIIETHKQNIKTKSVIKPFQLNLNEVTGLMNMSNKKAFLVGSS